MSEPPVDRVRISQAPKDQLIKLKRVTKIDQWNVLCRWAVCHSLAEPTPPFPVSIPADSNVEMTWQVFGGAIGDLLALKQRCHTNELSLDSETLATQFCLRLHRGIGHLAANPSIKSSEDFVRITVPDCIQKVDKQLR